MPQEKLEKFFQVRALGATGTSDTEYPLFRHVDLASLDSQRVVALQYTGMTIDGGRPTHETHAKAALNDVHLEPDGCFEEYHSDSFYDFPRGL